MIPNLSNAASSNTDLYKDKLKKKKKRINRDQIPNLSNAAKNNSDLYVNKDKKKKIKKKTDKKLTRQELAREKAKELARKRIGKGTAKNPDTTIAQLRERNKKRIQSNASKKNADFKKMRSGDMSKAAFIKKYPNSQTAKKSGVTTKRTVNSTNNKVVNKKNSNQKTYKKLNDSQFNKKFDVKKDDSKLKKFTKSGGLSGFINRRLKILKNMKKKDFLLNKK